MRTQIHQFPPALQHLTGILQSSVPILHVKIHPAFQQINRGNIRTVRMILHLIPLQISVSFLQIGEHPGIHLLHRIHHIILILHKLRQLKRYCRSSHILRTIRLPIQIHQSKIIKSPEEMGFPLDTPPLQLFHLIIRRQLISGNQHHIANINTRIRLLPIPVFRYADIALIRKSDTLLPGVPAEHTGLYLIKIADTCPAIKSHLIRHVMSGLKIRIHHRRHTVISGLRPSPRQITFSQQHLIQIRKRFHFSKILRIFLQKIRTCAEQSRNTTYYQYSFHIPHVLK